MIWLVCFFTCAWAADQCTPVIDHASLNQLKWIPGNSQSPRVMASDRKELADSLPLDLEEVSKRREELVFSYDDYDTFSWHEKAARKERRTNLSLRSYSPEAPEPFSSVGQLKGIGGDPVPWKCSERSYWRDLGPNFYPRFIRDMECTRSICFLGFYHCKPRQYQMKVLKRNTTPCSISDGIPFELRGKWRFQTVVVTLACDCGRDESSGNRKSAVLN